MDFSKRVAVAVLVLVVVPGVSAVMAAAPPRVVELRIDGDIEPVMAEYIDEGIDAANRQGAALILITMDTPGGLDTSMRAIIQHIIDSNAPHPRRRPEHVAAADAPPQIEMSSVVP